MILYLHGFLGRGDDWQPVIDRLGGDFAHLTVDLPGHGKTGVDPPPDAWSLAGCADLLALLLDRLGIGRATVVGYSMGGRLAWHLLLGHPERLSLAVIESAHPGLADAAARQQRLAADEETARRLEAGPLDNFLRDWYARPLFAPLAASVGRNALLARRHDNDPSSLARALRGLGLGTQADLSPDIRRSVVPQLLLTGELDHAYTRLAAALAARSPLIGHTVIPACGHAPHLESPAAFTDALSPRLHPSA